MKPYVLTGAVKIGNEKKKRGDTVFLDERLSTWLAEQGRIVKVGVTAKAQPVAQNVPARRTGCAGCGR